MSAMGVFAFVSSVLGTVAAVIEIVGFLGKVRARRGAPREAAAVEAVVAAPVVRDERPRGGTPSAFAPPRAIRLGLVDEFLSRRSVIVRRTLRWTVSLVSFGVLYLAAGAVVALNYPGADPHIGFGLVVTDVPLTRRALELAVYTNALWSGIYLVRRLKAEKRLVWVEAVRLRQQADAYVATVDPDFVDPNVRQYAYLRESAYPAYYAAPIWLGFLLSVMAIGVHFAHVTTSGS